MRASVGGVSDYVDTEAGELLNDGQPGGAGSRLAPLQAEPLTISAARHARALLAKLQRSLAWQRPPPEQGFELVRSREQGALTADEFEATGNQASFRLRHQSDHDHTSAAHSTGRGTARRLLQLCTWFMMH